MHIWPVSKVEFTKYNMLSENKKKGPIGIRKNITLGLVLYNIVTLSGQVGLKLSP